MQTIIYKLPAVIYYNIGHVDLSLGLFNGIHLRHHMMWPWTWAWTHGLNRDDSRFAPSQYETALFGNDASHWLGANLESALNYISRGQWAICRRSNNAAWGIWSCLLCSAGFVNKWNHWDIRTLHDCPSQMNETLLISNSKLTSDSELIWWR